MQFDQIPAASGHVFRREGKRGPVWYAKYRLPDGGQRQRRIGPAWTGRGRPTVGFFTKRMAEEWLRRALDDARERAVPGSRLHGVTFTHAAREWLRYVSQDRTCKPSTLRSYRSSVEGRLIPAFGAMLIAEITPGHLERWRSTLDVSARTKNKLLVELHGIFRRAQRIYGLSRNPAADVERLGVRHLSDRPPDARHAPILPDGTDASVTTRAAPRSHVACRHLRRRRRAQGAVYSRAAGCCVSHIATLSRSKRRWRPIWMEGSGSR